MNRLGYAALALAVLATGGGAAFSATSAATPHETAGAQGNLATARMLAAMLQSARSVVSAHQGDINDPARGDKALPGRRVLAEAVDRFRQQTGLDPAKVDPQSYAGRLLRVQMDAIVEVMDANQTTINQEGVGFKGFIPATFARLVNEAFERRVGQDARIKVTAPPQLVRNRQSRPDAWETETIETRFEKPDWSKGELFSALTGEGAEQRLRVAVPEYYSQSCLSCHGSPAGELDITGYPREGAALGDLGGVISIQLLPQ
ncbi:DUF3365 domain-containing protein [Aureimonas sp. AU20]|uniref:Tll0287-like domain-containing protein n=1 Tax=Aureimonas sp. AU20 TaxID=1349819 RepID=UPI0007210267|nr:DUF3365 domain-containing protein [Aureimonas sp. AU20]ALN74605.1 hypothetical protein M673_17955 [Aureimonas sp. AU20]